MPDMEQVHCSCQADDLAGWLHLVQTPGIGPATARKLLAVFGLPHQILAAGFDALAQLVPVPIARALSAPPASSTAKLVARTSEWLEQRGNHVVTLADAAYPRALLSIADPPLLLYVSGRLALLSCPTLAVVGSRNATAQGMANAEKFPRP